MICLVLAAGYATRMYPLTENFPKPLLKVGSKTILDYLVDDIWAHTDIESFIVISNHKFIKYFEDWKDAKTGLNIRLIDDGSTCNENRVGAVKDILLAIEKEGVQEDVLVIAGDNLLDFSFSSFVSFYNQKQTSCIMRYYQEELKSDKRYCVCKTDENDNVLYMKEKVLNPESHYLVPPFYIYKKDDLPLIKEAINNNCPYDAPGSLVEYLCSKTRFCAMLMPGRRYDVGTLESYDKIKKGVLNGTF